MKTSALKFASAITTAAMLSSCANIQNDQTRTRAEGAGAGALIGALAGGIIGNQSHRAWEGALIGGAVGGLAGLAVGDHVARKKAAYKSHEQWLDACISHAERVNSKAVSYNNTLSNRIDKLKTRLAAAKSTGNRQEMAEIRATIKDMQRETTKELGVVKSEIQEQSSVVNESGSSSLRSRITELKSTQSSLNSNQQRLADLGNQIDV